MMGLKQVYPGRYEPEMLCRLRRDHKVTYSHCVPTILQMILKAGEATGIDLAGWKMVIGGSALTGALHAEAEQRGMHIAAGYGMSETCPTLTLARPRPDGPDIDGDVLTMAGVPVPLVSVAIVDDAMNPLPHDGHTKGELVVRAPWLTPCYVGSADASHALGRGGWLHTQDIATIDAQGMVHIRDRLKDVIKTGGEWIDSIQLEQLVATAEGVAEACVVAAPDAKWGERPVAYIVPKPGAQPTLDALNVPVEQAIALGMITRFAKLDHFVITDQLPRTSVGKIDKKLLRATAETAA